MPSAPRDLPVPADGRVVSAAPDPLADSDRCATHPGRPAADRCPTCARPRCAADAAAEVGGGCPVCEGKPSGPRPRPPVGARALAGAAVLCHLAAVLSAYVGQQYVEVKYFSLLVPAGVGIVCAIAAERGAGRARGVTLRLMAVGYAVLSTGLSFRLEESVGLFSPAGTVVPPYLAAVAGAWFWTQPPSQRASRAKERSARA